LTEPGFGAQVVDQLSEREILLDTGSWLIVECPSLVLRPTRNERREL